jgi:hypothetical protein
MDLIAPVGFGYKMYVRIVGSNIWIIINVAHKTTAPKTQNKENKAY